MPPDAKPRKAMGGGFRSHNPSSKGGGAGGLVPQQEQPSSAAASSSSRQVAGGSGGIAALGVRVKSEQELKAELIHAKKEREYIENLSAQVPSNSSRCCDHHPTRFFLAPFPRHSSSFIVPRIHKEQRACMPSSGNRVRASTDLATGSLSWHSKVQQGRWTDPDRPIPLSTVCFAHPSAGAASRDGAQGPEEQRGNPGARCDLYLPSSSPYILLSLPHYPPTFPCLPSCLPACMFASLCACLSLLLQFLFTRIPWFTPNIPIPRANFPRNR